MKKTKVVNNIEIELTPEDEKELKEFELQAIEEAKTEYKDKRMMNYPSYGDQLDYIFHHGLAKWKTDIVQPVKDKFPKPE